MSVCSIDRVLNCPTLPSLPAVAIKVLELSRDPQISIARIAQAVQNDPALTTKVLRTVNSSYYSLSTPCPNISRAMSLLGLNTVKSIVLSFSLVDTARQMGSEGAFDLTAYWRRGVYSAAGARAIALATRTGDPEDAFVGALLQDIGMLASFAALRVEYGTVAQGAGADHDALLAAERKALGFDHAQVGRQLGERWRLAPELTECIAHHHHPHNSSPRFQSLVRCVTLGGLAAGAMVPDAPKSRVGAFMVGCREWFGLDAAQARELFESTAAGARELSRVLDLSTGTPPDVGGILSEAHELILVAHEAIAVEQATLRLDNEELTRKANRDGLTGMFNRAAFDASLREAHATCLAKGLPVSVIFMDADKFKLVNDQHGHQAGDAVLIETGRRLRDVAERVGTLCRYGGEEFVLVLPNVGLDKAVKIADLLRISIERTPFDLSQHDIPGLILNRTISAGVASSEPGRPSAAWTPEQLTHHADEAVYAAKQTGRNRVRFKRPDGVLFPQPGDPAPADEAGEQPVTHRILVVDDDPFVLRVLNMLFQESGRFQTTCVRTPEEACAAGAGSHDFQIALVDFDLGASKGTDLIARLQTLPATRKALCVLTSCHAGPEMADVARNAGAAMFIDKFQFSSGPADALAQLAALVKTPLAAAA